MVATTATVEKLVYGGDGLSRIEGEVVLTPFVLPGETAAIEREPKRSGVARGRAVRIETPSLERVEPPCPYFFRCGGCHYQHAKYEAQLEAKKAILREMFSRVGKLEFAGEIETISAEPWQYRNRIQLHFEDGRMGFHRMRSHRLVPIRECPISSPRLNQAIAELAEMTTRREWPRFLSAIELFTDESALQFQVLGSARPLAKRFFEWIAERLNGMTQQEIEYAGYRVSPGSFFQVNRYLVNRLIDLVTSDSDFSDVLDLYSGVGLFAIPLAKRGARVTAVESSPGAVRDLIWNAEHAGVQISIERSTADAFLERMEERPGLVIADPPRAGLGATAARRLAALQPREIRILACDPATLARDAATLEASGYSMSSVTMIDLFPQTYHIEALARFLRRN